MPDQLASLNQDLEHVAEYVRTAGGFFESVPEEDLDEEDQRAMSAVERIQEFARWVDLMCRSADGDQSTYECQTLVEDWIFAAVENAPVDFEHSKKVVDAFEDQPWEVKQKFSWECMISPAVNCSIEGCSKPAFCEDDDLGMCCVTHMAQHLDIESAVNGDPDYGPATE